MNQEPKRHEPSPPRVFVDPQTLFSLHVPPEWLVDTSGQQGTKVILLHPRAEMNFRTNINVTVQDVSGLTPEEFLTLTRLQFKQMSGGAPLDRDEPVARPHGAHLLEWSMPMGSLTLKVIQLTVIDAGKAYLITATAPAGNLEFYRPDFQVVFDSFVVNKPTPG